MRIIEVVADAGYSDTVAGIAEQHALDYWTCGAAEDGRQSMHLLVEPGKRQAVLDALQSALGGSTGARILVMPLEAALPRPPEPEPSAEDKKRSVIATREELYHSVEKGARLDNTYVLLVVLSTIVAAIGLIENNVAVVIGAMVIAPLLGPNIALALATAIGDTKLVWRALQTNLVGVGIALAMALAIGLLWPFETLSAELLARTDIGLDGIALALASGAAAVLSLTTGLPSVLVGVMVAVALLPPTATLGITLGRGEFGYASGALLLLLANVVCVNLAAKVVFLVKGVRPRTWLEKEKARQSMTTYLVLWAALLAIIVAVIIAREWVR